MPYVFISTQVRLENGPTICGDAKSDPDLMSSLGAKLSIQLGNNFEEYRSPHAPRIVLNMLEEKGYELVSTSGVGSSFVFILHKPLDNMAKQEDIITDE